MKIVRKNNIVVYVLLALHLILLSCVYNPTDPFYYDKIYNREFEYCKKFLDVYFIFRDSLPENPNTFSTPESLYLSVHDPFTEYMDEKEAKALLNCLTTKANIVEIGIEIDSVGSGVVITYVYPNSPGGHAQLQCGDTIIAVNNDSLSGISTVTVNTYLGIASGTTKILQIKRDSIWKDTIELGEYFIPSVYVDSINEEIAYIYLAAFLDITGESGGTAVELSNVLKNTQWANYTILDLRDNLGGEFNQCIQVASKFVVEKTNIIKTTEWISDTSDSGGYKKDFIWSDADLEHYEERTYYILINDSTAGASEILLSCLLNSDIDIKTFGDTTFGLGLLQILSHTPKNGIAKVTSALISSASETEESYNGVGIEPDNLVPEGEDGVKMILKEICGEEIGQYIAIINRINEMREKHRTRNRKRALCIKWVKKT